MRLVEETFSLSCCFQCPEAIVELFNCVLDHLAATVSSQSLQHISWPVSDFARGEKEEQGLWDLDRLPVLWVEFGF